MVLIKLSFVFGIFSDSGFQQLKSTEQGFLGSLKINNKGEIVGKLITKTSLTFLTNTLEYIKNVSKMIQIKFKR